MTVHYIYGFSNSLGQIKDSWNRLKLRLVDHWIQTPSSTLPLPIKSSVSTMILTSFSTMQENRAPFLQLKAKPYFVLTISVLCDLPSLVIPFPIFLPVYFYSPSDSSSSAHKHACLSHPSPYPTNISSDTNLISILCLNFLKEIPTVIPHFPFSFQFSTI